MKLEDFFSFFEHKCNHRCYINDKDNMKQSECNRGWDGRTIKPAVPGACRKLLPQLERVRQTILGEAQTTAPRRLINQALNEAEALAWQTMFPHLVFPALAAEKVRAVVDWDARQQELWKRQELSLAA